MKKVILLTTALAMTSSVLFAQNVSFGIKGGIQQTSIALKAENGDIEYNLESPGVGFQFGGVADISVSSNFSVQPNLLFNYRSGKMLYGEPGDFSAISVDIPINALYHNNGFFIGAGPNFSYGLSGKIKPLEDGGEELDFYEEVDGEDAPIKRFEIGANIMMGYQFGSGFALQVNYTRGFNNLVNDEDVSEELKWNTRQFGLTFSYMFNKKKK
jgi:hypothetical protein